MVKMAIFQEIVLKTKNLDPANDRDHVITVENLDICLENAHKATKEEETDVEVMNVEEVIIIE